MVCTFDFSSDLIPDPIFWEHLSISENNAHKLPFSVNVHGHQIRSLDLSYCSIPNYPDIFSHCKNLQVCHFFCTITYIYFQRLSVAESNFSFRFDDFLPVLPHLEILNASGTDISLSPLTSATPNLKQ